MDSLAVAIVTRKSTRDEQKVSIQRQEAMGRDWAERHHPDRPVLVFADNATSGTKMDRSGWVAFSGAVSAGQVGVVWTYEQSRLTRAGVSVWDDVCRLLSSAGIDRVHTERQGAISVVEGDRIHGQLNSVLDQHEREVVAVRTRDGLKRIAELGRPGAATGYGYRRVYDENGRPVLEPHPEQAPIVERIVVEVAAGDSLGLIARRLNDEGVPTTRGSKWTAPTVRAIVTAPRIVGLRVHRGKVVGSATWPPIVDREVWEQAQARLAGHRPGRTADRRRRYLLTGGLSVCAGCGTALISGTTPVRGKREPSYQCPHPSRADGGCGHCSILAGRLERHVLDVVEGWLQRPTFAQELNRFLTEGQVDAAPVREELAGVEAMLAELAEQWAAGEVLEFENTAARRSLLARRAGLLERLAELPVVPVVAPEELVDAWAQAVEAGDVAALREVVAVVARPVRVRSAFDEGRRLSVEERVAVVPKWA